MKEEDKKYLRTLYYREKRANEGGNRYVQKDEIKCKVCGRRYVLLGAHVVQTHMDMFSNMREYKQFYGLDVKRGIIKNKLRKFKAKQTLENGTVKNLEAGAKYRFVKGDKRAGAYKRSLQTIRRLRKPKL